MVTEIFCTSIVLALLEGKLTGKPEGVINDDVSIKKINNRKIRSVIDAMLKEGSILFFDPRFIKSGFYVNKSPAIEVPVKGL